MSRSTPLWRRMAGLLAMFAIMFAQLIGAAQPALAVSSTVVVSQFQVAGASAADEFIELHNVSNQAFDLNGYRLVYRAAAGTTDVSLAAWASSTMIPAGGFYLVATATGYTGAATANVTYNGGANGSLAGAGGGLALRNGALNTGTIIDSVGFGTATNAFVETTVTSAPAANISKARSSNGCTDTDNNSVDFIALNPSTPRNLSSTVQICGGATNPSGTGTSNPGTVIAGGASLLSVTVTPGTNPASTGLAVSADLSAIGGAAAQPFFDDGTNGDATGGDNIFSFAATVAPATSTGAKSLPFTITDAEARSGSGSIALVVQDAPPAAGSVVISQVYGGGGNAGAPYTNDFIELYNRTAGPISLAGWSVQYASSIGTGAWAVTTLSGSIAAGKYYLVQEAGGSNGVALPVPDATGTIAMALGAGKVALLSNTTALNGACPVPNLNISDLVGYGSANCSEGSPAPTLSNTTAAIRAGNGATDTDSNADDFTAGAPNPHSSSDVAPTVASSVPTNNAVGVALSANIAINFSEPVNVTGSWFTIACATSGAHPATASGGPTSFTLDPATDFVSNEVCTVTVVAAQVNDQDADDPPDTMAANYVFSFTTAEVLICGDPATPIHMIQSNVAQSPLANTNVTIEGVVVGDYQAPTQLGGFHVQEEDADADTDPTTSEGIFVFNSSFPVSVGDKVRVRGTVSEFGNAGVTLTELGSISSVAVCSSGNSVTPATVSLPVASLDVWERYESMLVSIPQDLTVTEHFTLGRFGEVSLSANGRLYTPTNIVAPGAPALAQQDLNDRSRILLDDGDGQQNADPIRYPEPGGLSASNTLRTGYTVHSLTGVLEQRFDVYRVQPVGAISFDASSNPRPAAAPAVGGSLRVVGMNLLNFFNTFGTTACNGGVGGAVMECRGAENAAEFARQWPKTVAAILALNADVTGVNEIENDGYGPDSAIQFLVNRLNEATAPGTYAFIDVDAATGQTNAMGSDAIKVGMIYKPAIVTPVGQTAALNSVAFVNGGDPAPRARPSLAQAWQQNSNGARFILDINHFKSKGSACSAPDAGDGQGNCNTVRKNAAIALTNWLATDPTGTGETDLLLLGDYNSYAKEDPITIIKNAGFTNLIEAYHGDEAYSYVFDGQSGYLDHAFGSAAIVPQVMGVGDYHINADEPANLDYNTNFKSADQIASLYAPDQFRVSDHDPVIVGLNLTAPNSAPVADDQSVSTAEDIAAAITLTASDADSNPLAYSIVSGPSHGALSGSAPNVTYTPAANYNGPDSFTFKVNDGTVDSNVATVSITITPVNDAPVANAQLVTTAEDTAKALTLSASDAEGASLTYSIVSGPSHGALSGSAPNVTYTPAANYNGPDSFTFKANDGTVDSNVATVSITVSAVNDAPTIVIVAGGQCLADFRGLANLSVGDPDGGSLTLTGSSSNTMLVPNANITFGGSGANHTVTIATAAGKTGSASVTVTVSDGTTTATITIGVKAGGTGNDLLTGTAGADMLFGGNGQDILIGGDGIDVLCGGNSDDALTGGSGDDALDGGSGNDILTGDNGNDTLTGGSGDDALFGVAGNDAMFGGSGNDLLTGGSGADLFDGGANIDLALDYNAGQGDTRVNIP